MALIIENGTIVANANSYATVAELRGYAALRGATVPTDDAQCEYMLIKAMPFGLWADLGIILPAYGIPLASVTI